MKTLSNYPAKIFIGKHDEENIYLSAPSWDCSWYWGFGYLGNKNSHYHVDGLNSKENINLFDAFKKHFGSSLVVRDSQLWTLCELFQTFYVLKETAEVLGRGGSHFTTNPCSELIINKEEVARINNIVLPAIFEEIYKILIPAQENEKINKQLVKLNNQGDTLKVVEFMNEYRITTDDLKSIEGITAHDFNEIHSMYWKIKHSKK
ncbi:MAG: hypothetical protein V4547_18800 [Bacteroidota bacterium]